MEESDKTRGGQLDVSVAGASIEAEWNIDQTGGAYAYEATE